MTQIPWLDDQLWFPPLDQALSDPDGLLAAGGDLSPQRLLLAYRSGIFPWFDDQQPILWWSPDPRCVLLPDQLYLSRSMRKLIRQDRFEVSFDQAFDQVIDACAAPRSEDPGTWITPEMQHAYLTLHRLGSAHSVEVWQQGKLVGGLYGVAIGRVFFGESMFSRVSNASKVGFAKLVEQLADWGYAVIDCQVETEHLMSLGACMIPRSEFANLLKQHCSTDNRWQAVNR